VFNVGKKLPHVLLNMYYGKGWFVVGDVLDISPSDTQLRNDDPVLIDAMHQEEQQRRMEDEAWHDTIMSLYIYNDDGFCDGFTRV